MKWKLELSLMIIIIFILSIFVFVVSQQIIDTSIIAVLIGGLLAISTSIVTLIGYDYTLRNKQRYNANQIIFNSKHENYNLIIHNLAQLTKLIIVKNGFLTSRKTIDFDNPTSEQLGIFHPPCIMLLSYPEYNIPSGTVEKISRWIWGREPINKEELIMLDDRLIALFTTIKQTISYNLDEAVSMSAIYAQNDKMLNDIILTESWLSELYHYVEEYDKIKEDFPDLCGEKVNRIIDMMKIDMNKTVENVSLGLNS